MANPVTKIRNTAADYRKLDGRDKRRFWTDGILNNALYILMAIFIIYTAIVNHNFLKIGSITNIISLAAASLPFALGVAGCIVLTGTDLSGGRVVGLSAALSAALLQKTDLARRMFSWMPNIPSLNFATKKPLTKPVSASPFLRSSPSVQLSALSTVSSLQSSSCIPSSSRWPRSSSPMA